MFGDLTAAQVVARDAEIVARLAVIVADEASTVSMLTERRALRVELKALREAQSAIADDVEVPEVAPTPEPVAPVVPAVDPAAIDAELSKIIDDTLVTASASAPIVMTERVAPIGARPAQMVTASTGETAGGPVTLIEMGNRMQAAARHLGRNSSDVQVASVRRLDPAWDHGFITADDRSTNNRVIEAAQAAHRQNRMQTAAAGGMATAACGVPNVWMDVQSCYMVDTGVLDDIAQAPSALAGLCEVQFNKAVSPGAYNLKAWCPADQTALIAALQVTPATAASMAAIANLRKPTVILNDCPTVDTLVACGFPVRVQVPVCAAYSNDNVVQQNLSLVQEASKQIQIDYLLANLDAKAASHTFDGSAGLGALAQIEAIISAYRYGANEFVDQGMIDGVFILEAGFERMLALQLMTGCGIDLDPAMSAVETVMAMLNSLGRVRTVHTGAWAGFKAALGAPGAAATVLPNITRAFDIRWYDAAAWFSTAPAEIPFGVTPNESEDLNMITWFGESFAGYGMNGCVRPIKIAGVWNFLDVRQDCKDLVASEPLFF